MGVSFREEFHTPVLLQAVLNYLNPRSEQTIVDATLGGGGHALAIAKLLGPKGTIVGIDLDPESVMQAKRKFSEEDMRLVSVFSKGNYKDAPAILEKCGITEVDGILADIGLSSYDLDRSGRGFSFQKDEPLDMRYDPESRPEARNKEPFTAKFILEHYSEKDLERIFWEYGEEKFSKKFARAILKTRQERTLATTQDLFNLIKEALPAKLRFKAGDSARRVFQALRIETNHELENLREFLPRAFDLLKSGGRLVIISFHSLEDRIVKQFFIAKSKGCICPPDFPECRCGRNPEGKILTKKPVMASEEELANNPRSKPAKLRAVEKIK